MLESIMILLIGNEPNLLSILRRYLKNLGYEVELALDELDATEYITTVRPDLTILDLDFDNRVTNGLDTCCKLRELTPSPIILLSSLGDEKMYIEALNKGIDGVLQKPFDMNRLLTEVRAKLRLWKAVGNGKADGKTTIHSDGLVIIPDTHMVRLKGSHVHLTPTEFNLLQYLVKNTGRVVTHRELLKEVWGDEYGDEREYLRVFISQLRKKIEADSDNPKYILTEPCVGYRFNT